MKKAPFDHCLHLVTGREKPCIFANFFGVLPMLRQLRFLFLFLSVALAEAPAFGQTEGCFAADDCSALRLLILRDTTSCPRNSMLTNMDGEYVLCPCVACDSFIVTPYKNNDPLNGVSTFDLVLINKHILGIELLDNPYKMIAADANKSNTISTTDIVELRKLILGIYTELPNVTSWRFIREDYSFPNPANAFADLPLPETAIVPPNVNDFVAIKVGDVNGNAEPGSFQFENTLDRAALQPLVLGTHVLTGRTGQNIEIPVFGLEQKPLLGWQAALDFDTTLLRVTGVRWAFDIFDGAAQTRGSNLAAPGELRLLWFGGADTYTVEPGRPLFFVQAELLRPVRAAVPLLHLHPGSISSEAYGDDHRHFALQLHTSDMALLPVPKLSDASPAPRYHLSAYPNPTAAVFRLQIEATVPCSARLRISDALGRTVLDRSLELVEGLTVLPAAQMPKLTPGTYLVSLHTPAGVETLRILRK